jgi:hypothetical protein
MEGSNYPIDYYSKLENTYNCVRQNQLTNNPQINKMGGGNYSNKYYCCEGEKQNGNTCYTLQGTIIKDADKCECLKKGGLWYSNDC